MSQIAKKDSKFNQFLLKIDTNNAKIHDLEDELKRKKSELRKEKQKGTETVQR